MSENPKFLYHRTSKSKLNSILEKGLLRGGVGEYGYVCLSEGRDTWKLDHNFTDGTKFGGKNSIVLKIDIFKYMQDYPEIEVKTWQPQSDEINVYGNIPPKYIIVDNDYTKKE